MTEIQLFRFLIMFGALGFWYLGCNYYLRQLELLREKTKREVRQLLEEFNQK